MCDHNEVEVGCNDCWNRLVQRLHSLQKELGLDLTETKEE